MPFPFAYSHFLILILAAKIAGFNRVELLNQSTSITMAYRHEFNENTGTDEQVTNENVLVLAVGAQTTEVFAFLPKPKLPFFCRTNDNYLLFDCRFYDK